MSQSIPRGRMPPAPVTTTAPFTAGIGLRYRHHEEVLDLGASASWWEVHAENYMAGAPLLWLERIRRDRPVSLHSTGLSLGSARGVDPKHLSRLAELCARIDPCLVSDHLSWSVADGVYLPDLLPLPMTEETLDIVCRNVIQVQDRLGRRLLVENPSAYLRFDDSPIEETDFLAELAIETGCGLLLDLNNVFVSGKNLGFDPADYVRRLNPVHVEEYHLAGHAARDFDGLLLLIDDHGSRVSDEVWRLFALAVELIGPRPALIEWDTDVPPIEILLEEAAKADLILGRSTEARNAPTV